MHIVQIIDTVRFGGAQKMQLTLAEAIQGYGVEMSLISLENNVQESHFPAQLTALGVKVHYFPANNLLNLKRIRQMSLFLKQNQVDLVHTHLTYANIVGILAARLAGIPVIASFRNASIDSNTVRAFLETMLMRYGAAERMAVGHATAAAHKERMRGCSIVPIPNAVSLIAPMSPANRIALRKKLVQDAKRPLAIAVGRLMPQKGYFDLIAAFDLVRKTHPDAALLIVGEGFLREQMMAEIQTRQLQNHLFMLGSRTDVPHLLAAADLYISSSHWEGLSNALLEAMAAGLTVVATCVNDTPNVVIPEAGILVEPKQSTELAEAISHYLSNPEQRQKAGNAGRNHIAKEFNPAIWVQKMLQLYHSVLPDGWNTAVKELA